MTALISGIKRHLVVDTMGLPHAIYISTANVTDINGALEAFALKKATLTAVSNVIVDSAYYGENFANQAQKWVKATVTVVKRSECHKFIVLPKRWIVERSFAWL